MATRLSRRKGITTILKSKEQSLYDPYLMHNMDKAISRIQKAVIEGEKSWFTATMMQTESPARQ